MPVQKFCETAVCMDSIYTLQSERDTCTFDVIPFVYAAAATVVISSAKDLNAYRSLQVSLYSSDLWINACAAGSSHTISLASLRKATGVLRAQKRRQRQMATRAQNGDAADGVLDVD